MCTVVSVIAVLDQHIRMPLGQIGVQSVTFDPSTTVRSGLTLRRCRYQRKLVGVTRAQPGPDKSGDLLPALSPATAAASLPGVLTDRVAEAWEHPHLTNLEDAAFAGMQRSAPAIGTPARRPRQLVGLAS